MSRDYNQSHCHRYEIWPLFKWVRVKSVQIIRQTRYDLAKYLTRIKGIGISPIEITMTDHIYVSRFEPIKRSIKILKFRVVYLCEVIRYTWYSQRRDGRPTASLHRPAEPCTPELLWPVRKNWRRLRRWLHPLLQRPRTQPKKQCKSRHQYQLKESVHVHSRTCCVKNKRKWR